MKLGLVLSSLCLELASSSFIPPPLPDPTIVAKVSIDPTGEAIFGRSGKEYKEDPGIEVIANDVLTVLQSSYTSPINSLAIETSNGNFQLFFDGTNSQGDQCSVTADLRLTRLGPVSNRIEYTGFVVVTADCDDFF